MIPNGDNIRRLSPLRIHSMFIQPTNIYWPPAMGQGPRPELARGPWAWRTRCDLAGKIPDDDKCLEGKQRWAGGGVCGQGRLLGFAWTLRSRRWGGGGDGPERSGGKTFQRKAKGCHGRTGPWDEGGGNFKIKSEMIKGSLSRLSHVLALRSWAKFPGPATSQVSAKLVVLEFGGISESPRETF